MRADHVVFHVADPILSAEWFQRVIGLEPVRLEEYKRGEATFPSVRINDDSIIDLSPLSASDDLAQATHSPGSVGHRVNHFCLAMTREEYDALDSRAPGRPGHLRPRPADLWRTRMGP